MKPQEKGSSAIFLQGLDLKPGEIMVCLVVNGKNLPPIRKPGASACANERYDKHQHEH